MNRQNNSRVSTWFAAFFLLLVCIPAFVPFIHRLGFYQDDWNIIYIFSLKGTAGIWEYYFSDGRPLTALLLSPLFILNSLSPLRWQITALLLRWLSAFLFWLCLRDIWKEHQVTELWAAALFLVYPYFNLQPMSAIYSPHWLGYTAFFLSLYLLIRSIKIQRYRYILMALSVLISGLGLVTIEYFAGVELLKILVVWWLLDQDEKKSSIKQKVVQTLKLYTPSLAVLLAFLYYRLVYITHITPREIAPKAVTELSNNPIKSIFNLLNIALQDTVGILSARWPDTFLPEYFDLSISTNRYILLIVFISALLIYLLVIKFTSIVEELPTEKNSLWLKQATIFSFWAILLGQLPAWGIGWHITAKNALWNSRLGLPAVFGLALLVAIMIETIIGNSNVKKILLILLLSLSIGWQLQNTNNFKNSWQMQSGFFQQFLLRAPSIEPGTTISSKGEFLSYVGGYPLSFAINTMYEPVGDNSQIPLWYVDVEDLDSKIDKFTGGIPIDREYYTSEFHSSSQQNISLYWGEPEKSCVWILRPDYQNLPFLPDDIQKLSASSDIDLIGDQVNSQSNAFSKIFGTDKIEQPSWCTFYQKADLARQSADWGTITALWAEAEDHGFIAQNGVELLPFIEGFARTGDWEKAAAVTKRANQLNLGMDSVLCPLWGDLYLTSKITEDNLIFFGNTEELLRCKIIQ